MKCKTSIFIRKTKNSTESTRKSYIRTVALTNFALEIPKIIKCEVQNAKSDRIREVIHIRHHRQEMQIFSSFPSVIDSFHIKRPRETPTAGESSRVSTIRQLQRKRQKTKPTEKGKKRKTKPSLSLSLYLSLSLSTLYFFLFRHLCFTVLSMFVQKKLLLHSTASVFCLLPFAVQLEGGGLGIRP